MFPIDTTGKLWEAATSNTKLQMLQGEVKAELSAADADVIQATIGKRWAEFCATPQDQAEFLKRHLPAVRSRYLTTADAKLKAAERAAKPLTRAVAAEYKCDHCGKVCASAGALTNHERVHG